MSSDNKKDLTRIEDLGEFIHELNSEEDFTPSDDFSSELPDLPATEEESTFESSESNFDFGTTSEDEAPAFDSSTFESSSFESSFETTEFGEETSPTFGTEDNTFESEGSAWNNDFGSSEETPATEETSFLSDESSFEEKTESEPLPELQAEPEPLADTFPELEAEPVPEPKPEPEPISEPVETYTPTSEYKAPETFQDLKQFSESSSFTGMATEGNPSFSILVKDVRYLEDVNDIVSLLKEFNLLVDSEEQTKNRLMRGTLLIPRISEYAAIFVAHKLRRFDVDLQIGLSDEIHPPKHQEAPEIGIVSKHSLYQNQVHNFHFDDPKLELSQIIVAATPSLEGYQVIRYMGVASEHKILESHIVEDENSSDIPVHYQELAQKLKAHALKNNSNAVVGLNYQLTPIPTELGIGGHKYRLTCTGNLVWVNKL